MDLAEQCVADNPSARAELADDGAFWQTGLNVVLTKGASLNPEEELKKAPDYFAQIPDRWNHSWSVLEPLGCDPRLYAFKVRGEQVYEDFKSWRAGNERYDKVCGAYTLFAPFAMFAPPPVSALPARLPGC